MAASTQVGFDGSQVDTRRSTAAVFQSTPAAWHGRERDLLAVLDELRAERRVGT